MAFPGVIDRPLRPDEFSIYLDNTKPIPLSALAAFLGKLDREARSVEGMEGLFLELSDFALGSNELRFRVVGPGRLALEEAARQERLVKAAETSASAGKVAARAAVVSAVAAVVALAIATGTANPATHQIVTRYNVTNIYVRAPDEPPHQITRSEIREARQRRLSARGEKQPAGRQAENQRLLAAVDDCERVALAGRFHLGGPDGDVFETMAGNRFTVRFPRAREYEGSPVALRAIVRESAEGLRLEIVDVIARLSDY